VNRNFGSAFIAAYELDDLRLYSIWDHHLSLEEANVLRTELGLPEIAQ